MHQKKIKKYSPAKLPTKIADKNDFGATSKAVMERANVDAEVRFNVGVLQRVAKVKTGSASAWTARNLLTREELCENWDDLTPKQSEGKIIFNCLHISTPK